MSSLPVTAAAAKTRESHARIIPSFGTGLESSEITIFSPGDRRLVVLDLIRRFGRNTTSYQTLARGYSYWFYASPSVESDAACVAYVDTGGAWVAAGEPIGPSYLVPEAALVFHDAARANGRRAVFVATEIPLSGFRQTAIGLSPEWEPREWPKTLATAKGLREQLRRARAKGVHVRLVGEEANATWLAIEKMRALWLAGRRALPLGFLVGMDFELARASQPTFVAEVDGEIVAAAILSPIPARNGFLLEHLMRSPRAPNGTTEALLDAVLRALMDSRHEVLSLGTAPLSGDVAGLFRWARRLGRPLYDFDGLFAFKSRLRPNRFRTTSLAFGREQSLARAAWDVVSAFTGGAPLSFGVRSAIHRLARPSVTD